MKCTMIKKGYYYLSSNYFNFVLKIVFFCVKYMKKILICLLQITKLFQFKIIILIYFGSSWDVQFQHMYDERVILEVDVSACNFQMFYASVD